MITQNLEIEELTGCRIDKNGLLVDAPCCCYGDDHRGHPFCDDPTPELLQAERDGLISRQLDHAGWYWYVG